jgi:hypothetical protein
MMSFLMCPVISLLLPLSPMRVPSLENQGMTTAMCLRANHISLRASPAVLRMWPCTLKLAEEKAKPVILAQENGFSPAYLHSLLRIVKGTVHLPEKNVINIIWLLLPVSNCQIITIAPGGLQLSPICSLSSSFMDGFAKK